MSAFGFTEESGQGDVFSLGDDEDASSNKSEQNSSPVQAGKNSGNKPVKRTGPRVIGVGGKKKPDKKVSKFAKKGSVKEEKPKISAVLTPGNIPPLQKTGEPKEGVTEQKDDEESTFDFGGEDTSAFDFGTSENANNDEVSSFEFGSAENVNDETSAFDFGNANEDDEQGNDGAGSFDFGDSQDTTPIDNSSPLVVENNSVTAATVVEDVPEEIRDLGEVYGGFALSMNNISLAIVDMFKENENIKKEIEASEIAQSEALTNEEFEKAEKIDQKIYELQEKIRENQNNFALCIQEAMSLAQEAPDHFISRADTANKQLPDLITTSQSLEKTLSKEQEQQVLDEQTIEIERNKNASKIAELQEPVEKHGAEIEELQSEYDRNVADTAAPFDENINEYESQKREVNAKIAELLKQVEILRSQDKQLQNSILKQQKEKKNAIDAYAEDLKHIASEKRALESQKRKVSSEVKKIEGPFQSLIDDVEKRKNKISGLKENLTTTLTLIEDSKCDVEESEKAVNIVNKLYDEYVIYNQQRSYYVAELENNRNTVSQSNIRLDKLAEQLITHRSSLESSKETISTAKSKEDQLEAQKKNAVASKNFKAAKICADQLKEFRELAERAENTICTSTEAIKKIEEETFLLKQKISLAETTVVDYSSNITKVDYSFFENAVEHLDTLFSSSPFSQKLLSGLKSMMSTMLEHTEAPAVLSKEEIQANIEELNAEIEKAVEEEAFDKAEELQAKVDKLSAQLEKLQ